jgi:hypothetical protein
VLAEAVGEASMATDVNAMMIRTGETITALVRVLASSSLVPDRSPTALRRRVEQIAKDLRRQASKLAADPDVHSFHARAFHHGDVGGRA